VNMLIKTQSKFAKFIAIDHVDSEHRKTERSDPQRESPEPSEIAMVIEMATAFAAALALLAMAAWVWNLANPDWSFSIHRLQDML
jgi:hypothetical protein